MNLRSSSDVERAGSRDQRKSGEMDCQKVQILRASSTDLNEVLALLSTVELPHEGVAENFESFLVARDEKGKLVGTIGIERYGATALLRSAAVSPEAQGSGVGTCLTAALLDGATRDGVDKVVLLTSTARGFFADRFGFRVASRANYDTEFAASPEWRLPRCASAVCMSRDLTDQSKDETPP
jgi:amino-acid N-acetyltransferase